MLHPFAIWLIAAAVLIGIEMITGAYVALSFGIGCSFVSIIDAFTHSFFLARDVVLFGLITIITFAALRRAFRHKGDATVAEADINRY